MTATDELRRMLDERGVKWMPIAWNPKRETFYHTSISVENVETLGDATKERRAEFHGYASKEVLEAALDMMRSVVADASVD